MMKITVCAAILVIDVLSSQNYSNDHAGMLQVRGICPEDAKYELSYDFAGNDWDEKPPEFCNKKFQADFKVFPGKSFKSFAKGEACFVCISGKTTAVYGCHCFENGEGGLAESAAHTFFYPNPADIPKSSGLPWDFPADDSTPQDEEEDDIIVDEFNREDLQVRKQDALRSKQTKGVPDHINLEPDLHPLDLQVRKQDALRSKQTKGVPDHINLEPDLHPLKATDTKQNNQDLDHIHLEPDLHPLKATDTKQNNQDLDHIHLEPAHDNPLFQKAQRRNAMGGKPSKVLDQITLDD